MFVPIYEKILMSIIECKYSYQNNGETHCRIKTSAATFNIHGFSRAGYQTTIIIDNFNLVFGCRYNCIDLYSYSNYAITHGHYDHSSRVQSIHCGRKLNNFKEKYQIITPAVTIHPMTTIMSAVSALNNNQSYLKKIASNPFIEAESIISDCSNKLSLLDIGRPNEYTIQSFKMDHCVDSFGYLVERHTKPLQPKYADLSPPEIIELKNAGVEITHVVARMQIAYTGDTTIAGVLAHEQFLKVPLLIMECTGFDESEISKCIEGKHIHFNDILKNADKFENECIVLMHFSQCYKTFESIEKYIVKALENGTPQSFLDKIVWFF